jgi:hypothetical protein
MGCFTWVLKEGLTLTLGSQKERYYLVFQPTLEKMVRFNPLALKRGSVLTLGLKKVISWFFQQSLEE